MQNLGESAEVVAKVLKAGISNLMNLAGQGGDPLSGVFFVNFNQDCSLLDVSATSKKGIAETSDESEWPLKTSLAVGSQSGYRLFSLNSVDKLEQIYENGTEDICIVERLFCSSLVAIVSLSSPRRLKVCHFKRGSEICNYSYSNTILAVKLNRSRLVVCLEESLYVHNIKDMKVMHTIRDTPPNLAGLCALSVNSDNCFLAYPGSNTIGEVQIFDAENLQAKTMIPAHDNPIAALAFDATGTKIATASEKGTVIRVFAVQDGTKLFEFRRGMKRCVSIYSLAFSLDSNFLCTSSNTETVHIFKLEGPKESKPIEDPQSWMGYVGKAIMSSASYLPTQVTDMFNQGRAFATVHLPFSGLKNVCALATIQKIPRLLVASADGYLYIYNLDVAEGGDCSVVKQHRLDGRTDVPTVPVPFETATSSATAASPPKERLSAGGSSSGSSSSGGSNTYSAAVRKPDKHGSSSYAGIVKGHPVGTMTDSDKCREMALALELPPKGALGLDDDDEFPPIS